MSWNDSGKSPYIYETQYEGANSVEKIKIPQEVADAIEAFRNSEYSDYGIVTNLDNSEIAARKGLSEELKVLRDWVYDKPYDNPDNFLGVLVNGYEVETEPLEVGDWAITECERTGKVTRVEGSRVWACWGGYETERWNPLALVRKMTPEEIKAEKERRIFAKIGREVGEFRVGDMGLLDDNTVSTVKNSIGVRGISIFYKDGELKGFFPAESFISFEEGVE